MKTVHSASATVFVSMGLPLDVVEKSMRVSFPSWFFSVALQYSLQHTEEVPWLLAEVAEGLSVD